jgi:hypothetical protein
MNNKTIINNEIKRKINSQNPYFPSANSIFKVKTDINIFPYNRFFRGSRFDMDPRIWDREAGWSPIQETIDTQNDVNMSLLNSNICFQLPCTTILPCKQNNFQPSTDSKVYISP